MVHKLWCTSLDCHSLARLLLHLRPGFHLPSGVANRIALFLKLPELKIVAHTETSAVVRYAFWNTLSRPFDFSQDQFPAGLNEGWLIACDFNFDVMAFNWRRAAITQ